VATVIGVASIAYYLLRDYARMFELAEALLAVSAEHGITYYHALAKVHLGAALAGLGSIEEGIARLTEGISAFTATGTRLVLPYCKLALADALLKDGRPDPALQTLDQALALVEQNGERYLESEFHRLKGEVLLHRGRADETAASANFEQAIEIARKQNAKSLELRATMSRARLLSRQGRREEAHNTLSHICGWFTEGFGTVDLSSATALVEELGASLKAADSTS
jgi:predicted ATPase